MAIYDVNRTELDSLIIGDVVTVVIDAGEYVTKELKIKRCAVVGDNSELPIIENFEVVSLSGKESLLNHNYNAIFFHFELQLLWIRVKMVALSTWLPWL